MAFAKAAVCEGPFMAEFCPITIAEATVRYAKNFSHSISNFSFFSGVPKRDGH